MSEGERPFERPPRIEAEALRLVRGGRALFADVSFRVAPGEYVEILGANGAGKTSLLRALAGFGRPDSGRCTFADARGALDSDARAACLHLIGHRDGLKPALSLLAHLRFWARLLGGDPGRAEEMLRMVGLAGLGDLPARVLSAGQGRRLSLARLLVAPRPVWLLDEPAASLDNAGKTLLADLIAAHRARGGLVLAATHEKLGLGVSLTLGLGPA